MIKITHIIHIGFLISLISCNTNSNKTVTFSPLSGQAILVGNNIQLLNSNFKAHSSSREGEIVKLISISDSLFLKDNDKCNSFHYIKVEINGEKLIADGRNVYQIRNSNQDISFQLNNKNYELKSTSFFGIGAFDEDGLTFCSEYNEPLVLLNKATNLPSLIPIFDNDISKDISWNNNFKYLELYANDGAFDSIEKIEQIENEIILSIKREFQEGSRNYQVKIIIKENSAYAIYLNSEEITY